MFGFSVITSFLHTYRYIAIFILMALESASFPIPSEIVLPLTGLLSYQGYLNPYLVVAVSIVAAIAGMAADYYLAYIFGKEIVYKHLHFFHVKRSTLDKLDEWFAENGNFAVFISRLLPIVRGPISFTAGFAIMDQKNFFLYSIAGTVIWDVLLVAIGYYALSTSLGIEIITILSVVALLGYLIYAVGFRRRK